MDGTIQIVLATMELATMDGDGRASWNHHCPPPPLTNVNTMALATVAADVGAHPSPTYV